LQSLRDDASDISDFSRNLLRARFTTMVFKAKAEGDEKTHQQRVSRMARKWASRAAAKHKSTDLEKGSEKTGEVDLVAVTINKDNPTVIVEETADDISAASHDKPVASDKKQRRTGVAGLNVKADVQIFINTSLQTDGLPEDTKASANKTPVKPNTTPVKTITATDNNGPVKVSISEEVSKTKILNKNIAMAKKEDEGNNSDGEFEQIVDEHIQLSGNKTAEAKKTEPTAEASPSKTPNVKVESGNTKARPVSISSQNSGKSVTEGGRPQTAGRGGARATSAARGGNTAKNT